jgi:hypothetical protein
VAQHLEDRALHMPSDVEGEDSHGHVAHMGNRRVGDQLLDVFLHQRDQRRVDDRDHRQRKDEGLRT